MKKILFPIFIWTFGLQASLCDSFSDLRFFDQEEETAVYNKQQTNPPPYFQDQLEKLIRKFIDEGDSFELDSFLNKTNSQVKREIISKQFSVPCENGSFITDFINLAIDTNNCEIVKILIKHGADFNSSVSDGYNVLTRATGNNSPDMIKTLVSFGVSINSYDANGNTALTIAARNSFTNLISLIVKLGANINLANQKGFTPLTLAIDNNDKLMVEELIKHGTDIELAGEDGFSPLNRAIDKNLPQIIELLVKLNADVNAYDKNGNTALKIAISKSHTNIIPLIVKLGANINLATKNGLTPLAIAIDKNNNLMVETLIKNGADIELAGKDGFSPLNRAVDDNSHQMAELLIKLGADVNAYDKNGNSALSITINKSYTNLAKLLIQLGANDNQHKDLPLINALKQKNQQLAEILLSQNININSKDSNENTALHIAIENSCDNIIPLLIKKGADTKIQNKIGINSILLAASYGKKEITKLILKNNSPSIDNLTTALTLNNIEAFKILLELCKTNPFAELKKNIALIYYALTLGNLDIIDLCHKNNPDLLSLQIYGHTPLHFAVMYGHNELVKYFVEQCKADINILDYYGATPLHYAAIYGNYEIANYLITKKCNLNIQIQKHFEFYQKESTPLDMAIQFAHPDIINLLTTHKAKTKTTKTLTKISTQHSDSDIAIFVDRDVEFLQTTKKLASVNIVFSEEIRDIIKQKACPIIIIGQHLLNNALSLSCSLKDWLIIEITYEALEGYVILPKRLIASTYNPNEYLDSILQKLGIKFSSIQHNCVDEKYVVNKKTNTESIEEKTFSRLIPLIIETLLSPKERVIYWGGHGTIKGNNPSVGNISKNDAEKLFNILANKKTKFVYVSSCFFGGNNLDAVKNFNDMIIVTGATTEITTRKMQETRPSNWLGFFNLMCAYKNHPTTNDYCSFLSNKALPLIITQNPHLSNFPRIKLPGNTKFTLLAINNEALLINKELLSSCKSQNYPLIADNKRLIEVDITQVEKPIEIKKQIPLIISDYCKNIFEKIYLENIDKDFVYILQELTRPRLFYDSTLENTFIIKELSSSFTLSLNINNKKTNLPKTLYNVLIQRGPSSECSVYFNTDKNINRQNSIGIIYDYTTNSWKAFAPLSAEEFDLYQQFLIQINN